MFHFGLKKEFRGGLFRVRSGPMPLHPSNIALLGKKSKPERLERLQTKEM